MSSFLSAGWRAALVYGLVMGGCAAEELTATEPSPSPQSREPAEPNKPVPVAMTCGEFKALLQAGDRRTVGFAILWLDGYYSGRSDLSKLPAGWVRTVGQGVGGTCAMTVNERRTVLDVIGQMHREYGGQN